MDEYRIGSNFTGLGFRGAPFHKGYSRICGFIGCLLFKCPVGFQDRMGISCPMAQAVDSPCPPFAGGKRFKYTILGTMIVALVCASCNREEAPDCLQTAGDIVRETVSVPSFSKITVLENVRLVLKQGPVQQVEVETGANLIPEVNAEVQDGTLYVSDTNDCNFFRDYGLTTVYVTAPDITEVRSSSGFPISSEGILNYKQLTLYSESFRNPATATTDGSFELELASERVSVVVNGIAYFKLKGTTANLNITIAAGDSRIEANGLVAGAVQVNHRGSNDVLINPQQSLSGIIRGTGDVISYNRPPSVTVEIVYKGKLFFRD